MGLSLRFYATAIRCSPEYQPFDPVQCLSRQPVDTQLVVGSLVLAAAQHWTFSFFAGKSGMS
jgi:hypothetical protein